jgi:hypothetical protein
MRGCASGAATPRVKFIFRPVRPQLRVQFGQRGRSHVALLSGDVLFAAIMIAVGLKNGQGYPPLQSGCYFPQFISCFIWSLSGYERMIILPASAGCCAEESYLPVEVECASKNVRQFINGVICKQKKYLRYSAALSAFFAMTEIVCLI